MAEFNLEPKDNWLPTTRHALYSHWEQTTGHKPGASTGTWACEIARGCRTCNEHLSLPCSLLQDANDIGAFLIVDCFDDNPPLFLRFYLMLLAEFTGSLNDVASLMQVKAGRPPRDLGVWTNKWAKHRLHILVQHHPQIWFSDEFDGTWDDVKAKAGSLEIEDRCGNVHPTHIIDLDWLANDARGVAPDLEFANDDAQAIVLVPSLSSFLDQTCSYFRNFIDAVLAVPDTVRQFEGTSHPLRCH